MASDQYSITVGGASGNKSGVLCDKCGLAFAARKVPAHPCMPLFAPPDVRRALVEMAPRRKASP